MSSLEEGTVSCLLNEGRASASTSLSQHIKTSILFSAFPECTGPFKKYYMHKADDVSLKLASLSSILVQCGWLVQTH
jgi:hypothetical protein